MDVIADLNEGRSTDEISGVTTQFSSSAIRLVRAALLTQASASAVRLQLLVPDEAPCPVALLPRPQSLPSRAAKIKSSLHSFRMSSEVLSRACSSLPVLSSFPSLISSFPSRPFLFPFPSFVSSASCDRGSYRTHARVTWVSGWDQSNRRLRGSSPLTSGHSATLHLVGGI